jgi:hypothetical protein
MQKLLTSRSAVLTYKTCPYKYFLQYHYNGHGVVPERTSLDLLIGTCVHRGLQHLLEHCREHHQDGSFEEKCIDDAVEFAREIWKETLSNCSIYLNEGELDNLQFIIEEQEALFEALIRSFAVGRLKNFLDEYEVLEVEKEEVFENFSPLVTWLGKADGLLRRKRDNQLVILSIKTASSFPPVTMRNILHDMQGLSEIACVEDRLNEILKFIYSSYPERINEVEFFDAFCLANNISKQLGQYLLNCYDRKEEKIKIRMVQYEFLLKGQRKQDPYGSGFYKQDSFLLHPYKMDSFSSLSGGTLEFSQSLDYKWKVNQGRQPKGWKKINIWEDIGVKEWINLLASGNIQAEEGNPFDNVLVNGNDRLVFRDEKDIREWYISTSYQEEQNARYLQTLSDLTENIPLSYSREQVELLSKEYDLRLMQYFPKNTQSCHNFYGKDCSFVGHCHEQNISIKEGIESGIYQIRKPHHEMEEKDFREKGIL